MGEEGTTETVKLDEAREWINAAIQEAIQVADEVKAYDLVLLTRLESLAAKLQVVDSVLKGWKKMAESDFKEQLDRIEAKVDWLAMAANAENVELARQFGNPYLKVLHVPPYPSPSTVPGDDPLPNAGGVPA